MVNMSLCQGVCYFYDEEDGWVVSFNMIDEFIFSQHASEEEAKQALLAVHAAMHERGYVVKVESVTRAEPPPVPAAFNSGFNSDLLSNIQVEAPLEAPQVGATSSEELPPPPPFEPVR